MIESPMPLCERTRDTPGTPFIAVSIGNETSVSTSSGASPLASVMIVTVGLLRSGKTSTGRLIATYAPQTRRSAASATTISRFCNAHFRSILMFSRSAIFYWTTTFPLNIPIPQANEISPDSCGLISTNTVSPTGSVFLIFSFEKTTSPPQLFPSAR